jgi:ferredoxin--NADP+ reductase
MSDSTAQDKYTQQTVLDVRAWQSPALVSVQVTKPAGFEYLPGQFARIGLQEPAGPTEPSLWRAYSMVSHPNENLLEFLSVTVSDGLFSPKLASLKPGDALWVEKAPFGFLTLERFSPAKTLWLVATGTGLSAYLPMLKDPKVWQQFEKVVLVHGVRQTQELTYKTDIEAIACTNQGLIYLPIFSQARWSDDQYPPSRITTAYEFGQLELAAGRALNPEDSRIMLCGNPAMVSAMRAMLQEKGFAAGRRGNLGTLAVENYW